MLNIPIFVLALGALAGATIVTAIWKAFFSKLAAVPGPFLARFTDLWYAWRMYRGRFEQDNLELHRKYGTRNAARSWGRSERQDRAANNPRLF